MNGEKPDENFSLLKVELEEENKIYIETDFS